MTADLQILVESRYARETEIALYLMCELFQTRQTYVTLAILKEREHPHVGQLLADQQILIKRNVAVSRSFKSN